MDKMMRLLSAVKVVADMRHPSVAVLLAQNGYDYEAGRVREMIDAFDAIEVPPAYARKPVAGEEPILPDQFRVFSSHGELTARADNGAVVSSERYDEYDPESLFIISIMRFDVDEWREKYPGEKLEGQSFDIMDFGGWMSEEAPGCVWVPVYFEPDADWRQDTAAERAGASA